MPRRHPVFPRVRPAHALWAAAATGLLLALVGLLRFCGDASSSGEAIVRLDPHVPLLRLLVPVTVVAEADGAPVESALVIVFTGAASEGKRAPILRAAQQGLDNWEQVGIVEEEYGSAFTDRSGRAEVRCVHFDRGTDRGLQGDRAWPQAMDVEVYHRAYRVARVHVSGPTRSSIRRMYDREWDHEITLSPVTVRLLR